MRRGELWLLIGFCLAALIVAALGIMTTRLGDLLDFRRSTNVYGPEGVAGLAMALERLGPRVERRARSLHHLADPPVDTTELIALIGFGSSVGDRSMPPSPLERIALKEYVERGGSLFVSEGAGIEECFGWTARRRTTEGGGGRGEDEDEAEDEDEPALRLPPEVGDVPTTRFRLTTRPRGDPPECRASPESVDTLVSDVDGEPFAVRLRFASGGSVTLLADSRFLSNRSLKETDAGVLILPLFLGSGKRRIVFDEYHHGFGASRSLWAAGWNWVIASPAGWALLQLIAAALLAIAVAAIRFGPVRHVVQRERRSALEHLDALAIGFERARARDTAVRLIVAGLRRRLARAGPSQHRAPEPLRDWLRSLSLAASSAPARFAVSRLGELVRRPESEGAVLDAAQTVESVWEALRTK